METTVQKQTTKRGVSSTLYDPRPVKHRTIDWKNIGTLKRRLENKNSKSPFVTCVSNISDAKKINTPHGMFDIDSPLSFHLNPVGFTTNIITNINAKHEPVYTTHEFVNLPINIFDKNEIMYRPIALDKYSDIIQYYLNRDIAVREIGIVIQPYLFWLTASSAGLVSDRSVEDENVLGLVEIKCPKSKRHSNIAELLNDPSFYIKKEDGYILLKKKTTLMESMLKFK